MTLSSIESVETFDTMAEIAVESAAAAMSQKHRNAAASPSTPYVSLVDRSRSRGGGNNVRVETQNCEVVAFSGMRVLIPLFSRMASLLRVLLLAGGATSGFSGCDAAPDPTGDVAAPRDFEVQAVVAHVQPVSSPIRAFGTVAALQTSSLTALVEGPVDRVYVQVGDKVKRGQPLLRVRQVDYQCRAAEAEAALRLAEAEARQAERTYSRVWELKDRGIISAAQFDEAEGARDVAHARRDQARTAVASARQALADTVLRAPFDGVVTRRMVDEGMFLAGRTSMGGAQSTALQLQDLRVVAAIVAVPESRVAELRLGQSARLFITGQSQALRSEVRIINDFIDPNARTVEVRLPVHNPEYAINSGVSVVAEIETDQVNAIVVPRRALRGDSAVPYLFVITDGIARRRAVKTADVDVDQIRIVEGLASGEQVILDPPPTLSDGGRVRLRETITPSLPPAAANRQ